MSARAMVSLLNKQARNDTVCDASYSLMLRGGSSHVERWPMGMSSEIATGFLTSYGRSKSVRKAVDRNPEKNDLFQTHDTYCILIVALLQLFAIFEMFSRNISTCMLLCVIHISTIGAGICTSQPIRRSIPTAFEILQHDKQ